MRRKYIMWMRIVLTDLRIEACNFIFINQSTTKFLFPFSLIISCLFLFPFSNLVDLVYVQAKCLVLYWFHSYYLLLSLLDWISFSNLCLFPLVISLWFYLGFFYFLLISCEFAWLELCLTFWWLISLILGLTKPSLSIQIRVSSHAPYMFDENAQKSFHQYFLVVHWYREVRSTSLGGGENSRDLDMKISWVLARSKGC